jgi:hypothetical protein
MIFYDLAIGAGNRMPARQQDTAKLLPSAIDIFRELLEKNGPLFRVPLPTVEGLQLQWRTIQSGAAMATFWWHDMGVRSSGLVAGLDAEADSRCLESLQEMLTPAGPLAPPLGSDLLSVTERPLIASAVLPSGVLAEPEMLGLISDAETCLAAAYFLSMEGEPHGLEKAPRAG